jgi:hypothetical protein
MRRSHRLDLFQVSNFILDRIKYVQILRQTSQDQASKQNPIGCLLFSERFWKINTYTDRNILEDSYWLVKHFPDFPL